MSVSVLVWSKKAQNNNETETREKSCQDKTDIFSDKSLLLEDTVFYNVHRIFNEKFRREWKIRMTYEWYKKTKSRLKLWNFHYFAIKKKLEMLIGTEQNYINLSRINFTHQTHNSTKTSFNQVIVYECAQLIN